MTSRKRDAAPKFHVKGIFPKSAANIRVIMILTDTDERVGKFSLHGFHPGPGESQTDFRTVAHPG